MELLITIALSLFIGFIIGAIQGWSAGKIRTRRFLSFMSNRMEQLRRDSKRKVIMRDRSELTGNTLLAEQLTKELESEGTIFYEVQHAISDWCINNDEKDPFAL